MAFGILDLAPVLARPVLAAGETTGHAHVATGAAVSTEPDGVRRAVSEEPITVEHEEHKSFTIPAGEYLSDKVREVDWPAQLIRPVVD